MAVQRRASLLKILGLWFGLAVTVGNAIGGGILRTPGDIATWLPNSWFFVGIWIVGACYALLGANALSELGTMLPKSGGQYVFARHAFGDYAGFLVGWVDWISTCVSVAAISLVLGESIASVTSLTATAASPIAMSIVAIFTILLIRGTRLGDFAQRITSLTKALALLALVVACFLFAGRSQVPVESSAVAPAMSGFAAFLLAAQAVIYAYDGWSGPIYFSEELDDPGRQIPRSMFYGLLTITAIYLLINIAFVVVLPTSALAGSPLAAATVASSLFGDRGELLVRLIVIASLPSAVNACLLMASRVLYSVSRDGLGLSFATQVNTRGTPVVSLVATGVIGLAFLATGTFNTLIAIAAFFFVAAYTLSFVAVFLLRKREPNANRPYRAVGHPWTTGFVLLGSLAFLTSSVVAGLTSTVKADQMNIGYALGILVASYPVFLLTRRRTVPGPSVDQYLSNK